MWKMRRPVTCLTGLVRFVERKYSTFKRENPVNLKAFGVWKVSQDHGRFKSGIFIVFNLHVPLICILRTCKHHHVLEIGLDLVVASEIEKK